MPNPQSADTITLHPDTLDGLCQVVLSRRDQEPRAVRAAISAP